MREMKTNDVGGSQWNCTALRMEPQNNNYLQSRALAEETERVREERSSRDCGVCRGVRWEGCDHSRVIIRLRTHLILSRRSRPAGGRGQSFPSFPPPGSGGNWPGTCCFSFSWPHKSWDTCWCCRYSWMDSCQPSGLRTGVGPSW